MRANHLKNIGSLMLSLLFCAGIATAQSSYKLMEKYINEYDFSQRKVPVIPPKGQKVRVIIDTDAKNEIDDQWAITLALLSPERFDIVGFVAAQYLADGPISVDKSFDEINTVLDLAGMKGKFPVYKGSDAMRYHYAPIESEGVDFIISEAMKSTPDDPLWIIGLGAATDIASAFLKEPQIAERINVFWHLRTRWPEKCWNYNVIGDMYAARILFHAPIPFVLFDTGTYLTCSMKESEKKVRPHGELGNYLHEYRYTKEFMQAEDKGFFDLGDIAAFYDPEIAGFRNEFCPVVDNDLSYKFLNNKGKILRCYYIDTEKTFKLFYNKLHLLDSASQ